jgi:hypothetical protein
LLSTIYATHYDKQLSIFLRNFQGVFIMSNGGQFDVLWPLAKRAVNATGAAPAIPDLSGKVVAELWDLIFRGDEMYAILREHLQQRYPGIHFVDHTHFGNTHGNQDREIVAGLADKLRSLGCDAVISGIGA